MDLVVSVSGVDYVINKFKISLEKDFLQMKEIINYVSGSKLIIN